ncbi:hypothetical protein SNEBB_003610 [Seison nebaliae]|nr:hypothetical protein SNEBB_003610 [Seison nebaliae]
MENSEFISGDDVTSEVSSIQSAGEKRSLPIDRNDEIFSKRERHFRSMPITQQYKNEYGHMNAYDRHKELIYRYVLKNGSVSLNDAFPQKTDKHVRDIDVIRKYQKFVYDDSDEEVDDDDDNDEEMEKKEYRKWCRKLAKRYWNKLFKEYCICDLTQYKTNRIGMRWRTEKEVVNGKGQFICSNKKCQINNSLLSWEINFGYMEYHQKKNELVKLRLCSACSKKLNYHHQRRCVSKLTEVHSISQESSSTDEQCEKKESEKDTNEKEDSNEKNEEKDSEEKKEEIEDKSNDIWDKQAEEELNDEDDSKRRKMEDEMNEFLSDLLL